MSANSSQPSCNPWPTLHQVVSPMLDSPNEMFSILSQQYRCIFFSLNPGSKPQGFVHALHEAISAIGLQLFKLSFRWSEEEVRECSARCICMNNACGRLIITGPLSQADGSKGQLGTLAEEFLNGRVPSEARFTDHLLASRWVRPCEMLVSPFTYKCS